MPDIKYWYVLLLAGSLQIDSISFSYTEISMMKVFELINKKINTSNCPKIQRTQSQKIYAIEYSSWWAINHIGPSIPNIIFILIWITYQFQSTHIHRMAIGHSVDDYFMHSQLSYPFIFKHAVGWMPNGYNFHFFGCTIAKYKQYILILLIRLRCIFNKLTVFNSVQCLLALLCRI